MTATDLSLLIRSIDAHPDDRTLLLAIADASDEAEWGSGVGWKALVAGRRMPMKWTYRMGWVTGERDWWVTVAGTAWLPQQWFSRLPADLPHTASCNVTGTYVWAIYGYTQADACLAAALAFSRCSVPEQQAILEEL